MQVEIRYTRTLTFSKIVEVSKKTSDRLLALDGESSIIERHGVWSSEDADNVSSDDFTMIAEDLTSIHDVFDALNEIEDFEAKIIEKPKHRVQTLK